jgi:drug/metabolite transporter (DMT)-like permease
MPEGPAALFLGHLLFAVVPLLLERGLALGLDAGTAVAIRFFVAIALILGLAALARWAWHRARGELSLAPVNRHGLLWRGIWGGITVLTYFYAVALCGAGLGTLLNYTHSLFSNLFNVLLGRQKADRAFWPLLALAGLGLFLVLDPQSGHMSHAGIAIGVLSGMAGGAAVLTIKALRRTDNALTINLALALGGLALSLPLIGAQAALGQRVAQAPGPAWAWVAASGVFSFGGQYFFNHGLKHSSVPLASLIALSTPALACLFGWLWLGEALTPHYLAGAFCIFSALGLRAWFESRSARPLGHPKSGKKQSKVGLSA